MTHQEVWAGLSGRQTTSSLLLVPPPNAVPLSTKVPDETNNRPQPLPDGEEDSVVLKYSDPFAVQPESLTVNPQVPSNVPTTGSDRDIMLLYQDSAADGPRPSPPVMATQPCCPYCGLVLSQYGDCPGGRCPLPDRRRQQQPQEYGDNNGGGLFPSLPRNREPNEDENHLLRRPGERLRELWPLPSVRDAVAWLIVAFFVVYFIGKFFKAKLKRIVSDLAATISEPDEDDAPPASRTTKRTRAR